MATPLVDLETVLKVLGDRTRLRILGLLLQGEICVCDIHETLKAPQPKVSRHLAVLRKAGLWRRADRACGSLPPRRPRQPAVGLGRRRRAPGAGTDGVRPTRRGATAATREQLHPSTPDLCSRRDIGWADAPPRDPVNLNRMTTRIGINGFGRMGRLGFRAGWDNGAYDVRPHQ